jgi:predicted esterase
MNLPNSSSDPIVRLRHRVIVSGENGSMRVESIETPTHGRVLVREVERPSAVVLGFHGYMENADIQFERLSGMPDSDTWTLIAVQGLHRFYRGRSQDVVASWMTRQDREQMIQDNIEFTSRVIERLVPPALPFFTIGFSQGVATAFRGGVRGRRRAAGIIGVGGDVPPELLKDPASDFPPVLLTRGEQDGWYTAAKLEADLAALRARRGAVESLVYAGGHDWTPQVARAAADWIRKYCKHGR